MNAKSVVIFSMAATGVVIVGSDAAKGKAPKPREVLGLFFVYLSMAAVADLAPKFAEPFSLLVLTGATVTKGPKLFDAIANLNPNSPQPNKPPVEVNPNASGKSGPTKTVGIGYPFAQKVTLGGTPGQGTHSFTAPPNNWESDNAVDLMAACNTPVYAVDDGTIGTAIGPLSGATADGRFAGLRLHLIASTNEWYYAHLSKLNVHAGQKVKKGDLLGLSGKANGVCHLHLGCKYGNPVTLIGA